MTKEQALELLDKAISQMRLSRVEHQTLIQALKVLAELEPKPAQ